MRAILSLWQGNKPTTNSRFSVDEILNGTTGEKQVVVRDLRERSESSSRTVIGCRYLWCCARERDGEQHKEYFVSHVTNDNTHTHISVCSQCKRHCLYSLGSGNVRQYIYGGGEKSCLRDVYMYIYKVEEAVCVLAGDTQIWRRG